MHKWLTAPLRLLAEASIGWLVLIAVGAVLAWALHLLWAAVYVADNHTGLDLLTPPEWISYWMDFTVLPSLVAWQAGLKTSAPQRGLALWAASIVVWTFLGIAAALPFVTLVLMPLALLYGILSGVGQPLADARRSARMKPSPTLSSKPSPARSLSRDCADGALVLLSYFPLKSSQWKS